MSIQTPTAPETMPALIQEPQPSSPPAGATSASSKPISILSHQAEPFVANLPAPHSPDPDSPAPQSPAQEEAEDLNAGVDPQIIEALKGKDRLFVLRVGEVMETLINERRTRSEVTTITSYQRLLVHRCSAYYKISPEIESSSKSSIAIVATVDSKIPARRISDLVPQKAPKQPAFKIMPRKLAQSTSKPTSRTGSVGGDDLDTSDVEPSEAGSLGGRSNALSKKQMTLEEREAAYNVARSRIFMGFEEKKEKENDMSASSSTFSLVSGSASTSAAGSSSCSAGDLEDSVSTAATESEWSVPITREKKEGRRSGPSSAASSSRSLRSSHASSSRNSRAPSPSFTYASLYEPPPPPGPAFEQHTQTPAQMPPYAPYMYPYAAPPGQPQQGPVPAYYYPVYPQHPMPASDPSTPAREGHYMPMQHMQPHYGYVGPYLWQPPPGTTQNGPPSTSPPHPVPYYGPTPPFGAYPVPGGYYPQHQHPPPHGPPMQPMPGQQQPMYSVDVPSQMAPPANGLGVSVNGHGGGSVPGSPYSRPPLRLGSAGPASSQQGKRRSSRSSTGTGGGAWSYGPGVGVSFPMSSGGISPGGVSVGSVENVGPVGPRLSNSMRKTSSTSNGSASTGTGTPGDEASSVASSTSSSSRRTYTSTTSSQQHPLPARPDWAVGLKAQPTLHSSPRAHNNHSGTMSSPARNGGRLPSQSAPAVPQSADFPPLSSGPAERRAAGPWGAWNNAGGKATIMAPPAQQLTYRNVLAQPQAQTQTQAQAGQNPNPNPNAQVQSQSAPSRLDEPEGAFERPPPKGAPELFNPKSAAAKRAAAGSATGTAGLTEYMGALGLTGTGEAPVAVDGGAKA